MSLLQNIFTGAVLIAVGAITLKYNYKIVNIFGRQDWVESRLGGGTTFAFFKILSVGITLVGVLYITGLGVPFFTWVLSPLRGLFGGGTNGN